MTDFALVFDLDGVIADTGNLHEKAWFVYCEKYQIHITSKLFRRKLFGRSNKETFKILLNREIGNEELSALVDEKEALFRRMAKGNLYPTPGLITFLKKVYKEGIPMGVASSAPLINVLFTLEQTKTSGYFTQITSAEEVLNSKPNPDIFLLAAKKLETPANRCLVFEDSFAGIEAAEKAGMKVIMLATTHPCYELPGEHVCIPDFIKLNLEMIEGMMDGRG